MHDPTNNVNDQIIRDISWGPLRKVRTYPSLFVNGYNFHTSLYSIGKATKNCGVCVKGSTNGDPSNDFYGVLQEVVELEYIGQVSKVTYLFKCDWYDTTGTGMRVHPHYKIVELNKQRRWPKYDPFVLAKQAIQVYYVAYPSKRRERADWLVACTVKARGTIEMSSMETAFQEEEIGALVNPNDLPGEITLVHSSGVFEDEVDVGQEAEEPNSSDESSFQSEEDTA